MLDCLYLPPVLYILTVIPNRYNLKRGHQKMNLTQAKSIAGTLGNPSKMPGLSYGISAHDCNVGSKLAQVHQAECSGSIRKNRVWNEKKEGHSEAQQRRFERPVAELAHEGSGRETHKDEEEQGERGKRRSQGPEGNSDLEQNGHFNERHQEY